MRRVLLSLLLLTACTSASPPSEPPLPTLPLRWSLPEPRALGTTALLGDLMLGGSQLTAVNVRTRSLAFTQHIRTLPYRSNYARFGDHLVAVIKEGGPQMVVVTPTGQVENTVTFPGQPNATIRHVGPTVIGESLYVISGPTLYKYRLADLLLPDVQPVWMRRFPGQEVSTFLVESEDRIYVSVNNVDVQRAVVAVDGSGATRWSVDVAPPKQVGSSAYSLGVYRDTLIVQAGTAGLQAYKTATGERAWVDFPTINVCPSGESQTAYEMTVAADHIYFGHYGGDCVLAFHAGTGKLAWIFDSPYKATFDTKPVYLNGVVYATNGRLWALEAVTGKALARGNEELGDNTGSPLWYVPVEGQLVVFGPTGVNAYSPLR